MMDWDMGLIRGVITALVFVLFMAIAFWAWGSARKHDFDRLAAMPLQDDPPDSNEADEVSA